MISFEPFWNTLKEKQISQYKLINEYDISTNLLARLRNNENLTLSTVETLCDLLNCEITDIVKFVKEYANLREIGFSFAWISFMIY